MNRRLAITAAIAAAVAMPAIGGEARVIERPPRDDGPPVPTLKHFRRKKRGLRSNEKRRVSLKARKKHKRAIAHASRRANRRTE